MLLLTFLPFSCLRFVLILLILDCLDFEHTWFWSTRWSWPRKLKNASNKLSVLLLAGKLSEKPRLFTRFSKSSSSLSTLLGQCCCCALSSTTDGPVDQSRLSNRPNRAKWTASAAAVAAFTCVAARSLSLSLCHSLPCFFHQFVHSSCRHFIHPFIHPFNSIPSLFPANTRPTTWLLQLHSIYQQFSSPAPYLIRNHPEPKNTRSRVQQNILSLPLALMHSFYTQSSWPSLNSTEHRNTATKLCVFELNQFIRR